MFPAETYFAHIFISAKTGMNSPATPIPSITNDTPATHKCLKKLKKGSTYSTISFINAYLYIYSTVQNYCNVTPSTCNSIHVTPCTCNS